MINRMIEVFDKKTENVVAEIELKIPDRLLYDYYKDVMGDDVSLTFEYEITKKDVDFYGKYMPIDFDFTKNDYFLSCYE